jgi:hypothetical protein
MLPQMREATVVGGKEWVWAVKTSSSWPAGILHADVHIIFVEDIRGEESSASFLCLR